MNRLLTAALLLGSAACSSCVARGALVRTPKGPRRIEDLIVGDVIYCFDPENGALHETAITATRMATRECVRLSFEGGSLTLTSDHPVYCPATRTWAPAGDWAVAKRDTLAFIDAEGLRLVKVQERSMFAGVFDVFDLTVEHALHNFIANDVLVHNKEPLGIDPPTCALPNGDVVEQGADCGCPDPVLGSASDGYRCRADGSAVCECEPLSCAPEGSVGADGGAALGGSLAFPVRSIVSKLIRRPDGGIAAAGVTMSSESLDLCDVNAGPPTVASVLTVGVGVGTGPFGGGELRAGAYPVTSARYTSNGGGASIFRQDWLADGGVEDVSLDGHGEIAFALVADGGVEGTFSEVADLKDGGTATLCGVFRAKNCP